MTAATILDEIVANKRQEVASLRESTSLVSLKSQIRDLPAVRGFTEALCAHKPAVIAEIKRASPSKGLIREDFQPVDIAQSYERSGATCLSVLTDSKYFQGSTDILVSARQTVDLPVLRKDFIVDEYQIFESRVLPADCVLLIVAALETKQLDEFYALAKSLGLDVLVEVHDEEELSQAIDIGATLIGVNNRNLKTFKTDLGVTERLAATVPEDSILVSESGIHTKDDVRRVQACGVNAFLVGEAFMRQRDPGRALEELFHSAVVS